MESEQLEIPAQAQKPQFSLRKVLFSNNFLSLELSFQRNLTKWAQRTSAVADKRRT